ncbi:MAG: phenylalanyl-tRNA synthetase beta chain [Saprospiraceae bacterium]|jgi:phenylalanyl-tRNA synthetase beta chain
MLISESWLREWVALSVSTQQLCENLIQAGLEVETVEPIVKLGGLVKIGEVVAIERHPDADKLNICQVDVGTGEQLTIVCGAANAALGIKAPVAIDGAVLPNGLKIEQRSVRGVDSCGMICSAAELGFEEQSSGLMLLGDEAKVGDLIDDYLQLDDNLIDVDLTPDRGDCLSIAGVAREMGVIAKADFTPIEVASIAASHKDVRKVTLASPKACPRYVGRIIKNINANAQSPDWMQEKLRRVGLRSIDPIVDVTNYVMIELGQPMHAFDHGKISGDITVRMADQGETLLLLDGQTVELDSDMLLITDEQSPIALAGVMGGLGSAIDKQTKDIYLEAAHFAPDAIIGRARRLGMHTDASHRFERGVDYLLAKRACERASELLQEIVGGEYGEIIDTLDEAVMPSAESITLRPGRITKLLGLAVEATQVEDFLTRLGMDISTSTDGWNVVPPSWRFDVTGEHDLIEEVGRTVGLDKIQPRLPKLHQAPENTLETTIPPIQIKTQLAQANFREVVSYSFVDPSDQQALFGDTATVNLANPIADNMSQMRLSIWTGLLNTARVNQQRQHQRHRYFELGNVFEPQSSSETGVKETPKMALLLSGTRKAMHWAGDSELADYYDLKGELDRLFASLGLSGRIQYQATTNEKTLHPGQSATITLDGNAIGLIGALHPSLQNYFDLNNATYLAELDLNAVSTSSLPAFTDLSRFPESKRDIALVVDMTIPSQQILNEITKKGGKLLKKCTIFDTYTGEKVQQGKKSLAVSLTFQSISDSVSSEEVESTIGAMLISLGEKFDAQLRT